MGTVWPTHQCLNKMKLVTYCLLFVLTIILPNVYAQGNPAADIIKKSMENLKKFENKSTSIVQPPVNRKVTVPTVSSTPKPKADFVNSNFAKQVAKDI